MSNPTELPDLDYLEALRDALEVYAESYDSMAQMNDGGNKVHCSSVARDIRTNMVDAVLAVARRAQPEGEAPQADWQAYALNLRTVLERGYKSLASAAMCQTRDGEAAWHAMGEALKASIPAATLSPLCGAQHAESGKEVEQELRNQMAFIAAYDPNELDGGDSQEGMRAADRLACIIRRARKTLDVCDALAAQQAAAPGQFCDANCVWTDHHKDCTISAPGTPEAPKDERKGIELWRATLRACGELPEGYEVRIELENGCGMAVWYDAEGERHVIDGEGYLSDDVNEAVDAAIQRAAQLDGGQEGSESNG